ncbi:MAG: methyltransferase [Deltaproteobacteria bacterium]|jgi:SAM-dependent methyltransferase|nr:methyltransferase [Deltaproteobacteria bacterium]
MNNRKWHPGELLELSGYFWRTCTLHAAVKLDVFTRLGDEQLSAGAVATRLEVAPDAVQRLLNALTAMELLAKAGDRYANTPSSKAFLSKKSPQYLGNIIMHHHHLVASWAQLDMSVRKGKPIRKRSSFSDGEWRESFLMGMFNMAMNTAPMLIPEIDISARRHLLDLGGGPGTYAIHFCRHNPDLKATVFDLPATQPFAEKTIKRFELSDRIDFQAGNYLKDEIQGHYDAVWLSHILHGEGPDGCRQIIQKAVAALEPGGIIIIHEFILNNTMDGPLFPALFSLNMLLGTDAGQAYSEQQLMDMLTSAGAKQIQRVPVQTPNDSGIITAIV